MRCILKGDKEDGFKVAELKEITAVELLIINKALHLLSQNEEVAERDRYVAEKLGAELMRMDAVQRPLTAIDGADIADTPQTEETCERCVYVRGSQWCQGCNGTPKRWDGEKIVDTPQPDCKSCKQYGAVSVSCDRCDKSTHSNYEP